MGFGSRIQSLIKNILYSSEITSANPTHTNTVKNIFETPDFALDEEFSSEVVRVIREEIKIQLTEQREDITKQTPIGSLDSQAASTISKGIGIAQNPAGIATELTSKIPHTALVLLAVSLTPMIIDELTRPGGIMDIRFRRKIENEWNGFLDRQTQKNTQIGLRSMIVQSSSGFTQINGAGSANAQRIAKNTQGFIEKNNELGLPSHALRYD